MTTQNWATNHAKEAQRVRDTGKQVILLRSYKAVIQAPLSRHGLLAFVLLTAGWFCDSCGEKVIPSKFEEHAKKAH